MASIIKKQKWSILLLFSTVMLAVLLAACGAGTSTTTSPDTNTGASVPINAPDQHQANTNKTSPGSPTQQYLIKSLNITMEVKDTQKVANELQTWISTTDPLSTAENINYQQVGDNLYNITMAFSVQASLYPRIENYLNTYPPGHSGRLLSTTKNTQDVTGDYVDTQSRLKNLHGEQDRLLTLLSHASVLGDILAIDQRLTDVEGQIEQIDAHLNQLNGQTTFYNITITLQPSSAILTPPPAAWSPAAIWQSALGAALAFAEVLATVLIWLAVFSIYIIPLLIIAWFIRRWRRMQGRPAVVATSTPPPSA